MSSATATDDLSSVFTDEFSQSILDFWFAGSGLYPTQEEAMRWFQPNDEFDGECRSKFASMISTLSSHPASSINALATSPSRALSLLILLDQLPRNIFRGDLSAKAYTETDPLASSVSLYSVSPSRRYDLGPDNAWKAVPSRRMWFYLPLIHSEDLALHKQVEGLVDELREACVEEEKRDGESPGLAMVGLMKTSGEGHKAVIEKFGRYPYRNKVLGREDTPEEKIWLENPPKFAR